MVLKLSHSAKGNWDELYWSSFINDCIQHNSETAREMAQNLASIDDLLATVFCLFELHELNVFQDKQWRLKWRFYHPCPPVQSEFVKTQILMSFDFAIWIPLSIVPFKYRRTFFKAVICIWVGLCIYWGNLLTTKEISGLVINKCWRDPIIFLNSSALIEENRWTNSSTWRWSSM